MPPGSIVTPTASHARQVGVRLLRVDEWPLVRRIEGRIFDRIVIRLRFTLRALVRIVRIVGLRCRRRDRLFSHEEGTSADKVGSGLRRQLGASRLTDR